MKKCVYIHKTLNDDIFYVGCGSETRPYETQGRLNQWWLKANNGYNIEIVKDNLSSEEAFKLEHQLILKYGRLNNGTGPLVNKNNGYKLTNVSYKTKKLIDGLPNKKIINFETGEIYNSIQEASDKYKIGVNTLIRHLEGKVFNKIKLKYK